MSARQQLTEPEHMERTNHGFAETHMLGSVLKRKKKGKVT